MSTKEKKKKLTLKNFTGNAPSSVNKKQAQKTSAIFGKKEEPKVPNPVIEKSDSTTTPESKPSPATKTAKSPEKPKSAKEWAKIKIQEELSKKADKKAAGKKRDYRLTVTKALSEEEEVQVRSLAAVKRSREKLFKKQSDQDADGQKVIRQVKIPKVITIQELANRMAERANAVIKYLLTKNVKVTINHTIDQDTAEFIVKEFGHEILIEEEPDQLLKDILSKDKDLENAVSRPPVVTVMGHVDHGKTSLLDSLRDASVVNSEHGGITQHIGAYQVNVNDKSLITFIDTPGHAAFTEMRARGSKITDIVILVVAANDGIKPQTIEAIQHAKAAQVPIIVAINKCDLQGADPTKVRNQLLEHELIVEEMGGDVLSVEISALKKTNLDKLKELILLQSEILDMKADPSIAAAGVVVESRLDKGRGPVSTVLIVKGTLKKGDLFVSGASNGKVRAIYNYKGDLINEAGPSTPVEIVGFQGAPNAGDDFVVVENDSKVEEIVEYRQQEIKNKKALILGAGGVVPSIIIALKKMQIEKIYLSNRTELKATELKKNFPEIEIIKWGETLDFDIIINATSIGLKEEDEININYQQISKDKFFYDVIYNPPETNFLKNAKKYGGITKNGKMMFIYQAQKAFFIWHKAVPEVDNETINLLDL